MPKTLASRLSLGTAIGALFIAAVTALVLWGPVRSAGDPPAQIPPKVVVIGDSYTGGSGQGGVGPSGWPEVSWSELRNEGLALTPDVSGSGGSGYVTRGIDGTTLPDAAARLVSPDDSVVVYFGGLNDNGVDPVLVRDAARQTFAATRATAPCARLVVIGPAWPNAAPAPTILGVNDVLRDEAIQAGAVFVNPLAERWFGDDPSLIGADSVHPNDAGHQYIAQRVEPVLRDVLRSGPAC